ncbi:hypothetical protein [Paracoccus indicus]|uniref:hypothetical protein n=1 Tax=Paracoccus indicus TaxID=2079229 RepID=UPI0013B379A2|nr:hypothetical protein [Paracoccus indicus]
MKMPLVLACNPCIDLPEVASPQRRTPLGAKRNGTGPCGGHHASSTGIDPIMPHAPLLLGSLIILLAAGGAHAGQVDCRQSAGVDQRLAGGLCQALRGLETPPGLRLRVLATTPSSITAMLVTPQGKSRQPMRFNIMDRDPGPEVYSGFARDLLRFGLSQ